MAAKDKTLNDKLVAVGNAVAYLQKDGENSSQRYNFLSERKVKEEVGKALRAEGLSLYWEIEVVHFGEREVNGKSGFDAIVRATVSVTDGQNERRSQGIGMARNAQDKAIMSAQTAAVRETLKSLFLIASGDDPELAEGTDGATGETTKRSAKAPEQLANEFLDRLKRCATVEELEKVGADIKFSGLPQKYLPHLREMGKKIQQKLEG